MSWAVWLVLGACTGDDVGLDGDDPMGSMTQDCSGADEYVAGVSVTAPSGRVVEILDADPTPPDVGDNTWTLSVTETGGAAMGLAPVLTPWMPLHDHGLVPTTYAAADEGDGTYTVETFDLIMPGLWEFTIDLGAGEGIPDEVVFRFCAEG